MEQVKTISAELTSLIASKVSDYVALVKLRLSLMVVFSAGATYLLGTMGAFHWPGFWMLSLGGFLVTGASNTINQMMEKDFDAMMSRTANRPLAAERMSGVEAALAAGIMGLSGLITLAVYFNPLTALISAISLLLYSFLYTPLKRVSPIAVFIGAIPGALPVIIGWIAATGAPSPFMWILFSIQFLWQFPHFWAIAWVAHEDYTRAGFKLLPSTGGRDLGMSGLYSTIGLLVAGVLFLLPAIQLFWTCSKKAALALMFGSFVYLPIALMILLVYQF
ncbi:MAG: protoheme IX farnesyltransferase [Bacteroidetes bacterium SW_11_45_7]|nr:MAG: protoheme IX farnesyltransferase [Bacteroidetes bacterium SW_11_45_7]